MDKELIVTFVLAILVAIIIIFAVSAISAWQIAGQVAAGTVVQKSAFGAGMVGGC